MSKAFRLAFCEFSSANIDEELAYYTGLLGLTEVLRSADGAHYLSLGLDHHNVVLRPDKVSGILSTGFQLSSGTSLEALQLKCVSQGFEPKLKQGTRPGVAEVLEVLVAGHRFEFFTGMEMPAPGFAAHGIVPLRLGHVALMTPDADVLVKFFEQCLGFFVTDWFDSLATFLTCNRDHHTINIINAPFTKLHHLAFEMRSAAHQYEASDQLAKARKPIVWGPSRHTAGHNYASYHFDPDRTLVEFYTDMDIYLSDVGYFEPRPWHEELPQRPRVWSPEHMNAWDTRFDFDFRTA